VQPVAGDHRRLIGPAVRIDGHLDDTPAYRAGGFGDGDVGTNVEHLIARHDHDRA